MSEAETPLLDDVVRGSVDFNGLPAVRSNSGCWKSASFLIGVEVAERFAYYGISSNLISYFTGPLGQSTATAAENVNIWDGTAALLPLLSPTLIWADIGLGLLSLSAAIHSFNSSSCKNGANNSACSPPLFEVIVFLFSLYLVAFAKAGHKPCVQAFGADQFDEEDEKELRAKSSFFNEWRFLDKAIIAPDGSEENVNICSLGDVDDAKTILRLVPIWFACLGYTIVFAQASTLFTKQGATMDRSIAYGFQIPAASLQSLIALSIVVFIPIYDRILVPIARAMTKKPAGISMLQRIGTGMFLSFLSMVIAALVERRRLVIAIEYGLVDEPMATVPMSVWWLAPQYLLFGIADVFTMVGLQEFFYDQVPSELKSIGVALYLSIFGIGSFLSSFLISIIEKETSGDGHDSWFSNNLNRAHVDYFYWLLAGLSAVTMAAYAYFAKSYIYKRKGEV
ncbi:hypothetical protein DH2020_049561 [Rehmannia glutinosa]|uniref:Uncharacterized protein n=1 Tax=Rehmannia glutinosa TaxID=99300 RepID=A0ABR0U2G8_REHGL